MPGAANSARQSLRVLLSALSTPARVVVRTHLGSLPATGAAPLALPDLPGAGTTTVNWQTPGAAALPRDIVDAPLAAQDIPLPVLRPAAGPTDVTLIVHAPARLSADDYRSLTSALTPLIEGYPRVGHIDRAADSGPTVAIPFDLAEAPA